MFSIILIRELKEKKGLFKQYSTFCLLSIQAVFRSLKRFQTFLKVEMTSSLFV